MIKVIAGKYRSRILKTPEEGTLPSKNIVREAMASCLGDRVSGGKVLDLFAGSGALGIECLSRGASKAIFVEKEIKTSNVIAGNLSTLGEKDGEILTMDYKEALEKLKNERFDIIFADPPYALKESYPYILNFIIENKMIEENGILILEYEGPCPISCPSYLKNKEHRFGKSRFITIRF